MHNKEKVDQLKKSFKPESSIPQHTPLTPNTRQRKSRLAKEVFQAFTREDITKMAKEDQVDILELLMRKLGLQNEFSRSTKTTKAQRKLTPMNV